MPALVVAAAEVSRSSWSKRLILRSTMAGGGFRFIGSSGGAELIGFFGI
jgi:hypothetical protein